ncbi:aminotransferase class III-fold pyridoxal phosphate-dependent enzyme [Natroniella acetigena]|uniref:aspartate aminotransferase family protein n=1 Tax=Natroniella acetigena TaxID=52004 RepID=UPI00200B350E|nr:aminotransferase class III-fold pyridoxal phosphate-dependent enzyme [Natroniella acetigena]MCK8827586.1 aminotransferase class III-fold pyridoxal phosphate-dependent enzyme [Natroniella acetigena]
MEDLSKTTMENYKEYVNSGLARLLKFMGLDKVEWEADGLTVKDITGNEYLDFLGGYGTFILGHKPPKVVQAVKEQLDLMPLSSKILLNQPLAQLAEELGRIAPGNLKNSFICNSGTEAVEGALKLARLATGRSKIITTENSFHGKSYGALSVTGRDIFRKPFEPLLSGIEFVPFGNIKSLEQKIDYETAAVIIEPIQGEGGIILPPENYLLQVRELCDKYETLLILDEIQTGLGRTGKMFACQHYRVSPDILTLAKALGGGVMPVGAVVATADLWEVFNQNPFLHTSTFGGNQLACRAALATLKEVQNRDLVNSTQKLGDYLLQNLKQLAIKYSNVIQEVRGKGLMIGIEFKDESYGGLLISELVKEGVLVAYTLNQQKVVRLEPPLIVVKKELDSVLIKLDRALSKVIELAS